MSAVYLNGKPVENPHEDHHHVSPVWQFTVVYVALLILTIITYLVSFIGLGPASLPVAMTVATIKAALVVGYFMHLKYEDRFYSFLFLSSLFFVAIFFTFVLFDMEKTGAINEEGGIEWKRRVEDQAEAAANAPTTNAPQAAPPAAQAQH